MTTYVVNATTAMPKPGNMLLNMARFEKTGCFRHASRLAQGSRKRRGLGGFAIYVIYDTIRRYGHLRPMDKWTNTDLGNKCPDVLVVEGRDEPGKDVLGATSEI